MDMWIFIGKSHFTPQTLFLSTYTKHVNNKWRKKVIIWIKMGDWFGWGNDKVLFSSIFLHTIFDQIWTTHIGNEWLLAFDFKQTHRTRAISIEEERENRDEERKTVMDFYSIYTEPLTNHKMRLQESQSVQIWVFSVSFGIFGNCFQYFALKVSVYWTCLFRFCVFFFLLVDSNGPLVQKTTNYFNQQKRKTQETTGSKHTDQVIKKWLVFIVAKCDRRMCKKVK